MVARGHALVLDANVRALELAAREPRHVEELGRPDVRVALPMTGLDAREVDPNVRAGKRWLGPVDEQRPAPAAKAPVNLLDHDVPQVEGQARPGEIDVPALGGAASGDLRPRSCQRSHTIS